MARFSFKRTYQDIENSIDTAYTKNKRSIGSQGSAAVGGAILGFLVGGPAGAVAGAALAGGAVAYGTSQQKKAMKVQQQTADQLEAERVQSIYDQASARTQRLSLLLTDTRTSPSVIGGGLKSTARKTETSSPSILGQLASKGGGKGTSGTF